MKALRQADINIDLIKSLDMTDYILYLTKIKEELEKYNWKINNFFLLISNSYIILSLLIILTRKIFYLHILKNL